MTKKDIIKAIEESPNEATGNLFDFIACDGWQLSKGELIDLIKELSYSTYSYFRTLNMVDDFNRSREFNEFLVEDLKEQWWQELED